MSFEKTTNPEQLILPMNACSGKCDCSPNNRPTPKLGGEGRSKTLFGEIKSELQKSIGC